METKRVKKWLDSDNLLTICSSKMHDSVLYDLSDFVNVCGACAAASADDLRAGIAPLGSVGAVSRGVAGAGPAAVLRIPAFAGVWVYDDWFVGSGAEFSDQCGDQRGVRAVDANGYGLRKCGDS